MARKTENRARADIVRGKLLDLGFIKENQEFRADIARLNGMPNETMRELGARARETVLVGKKWGLSHLPITQPIDVDRVVFALPVSARIEGDEAVVRIKLNMGASVDDLCVLTDQ